MIKNLYIFCFFFIKKQQKELLLHKMNITIINSSFVWSRRFSPAARAVVETVSFGALHFGFCFREAVLERKGDGKMHLARKKMNNSGNEKTSGTKYFLCRLR